MTQSDDDGGELQPSRPERTAETGNPPTGEQPALGVASGALAPMGTPTQADPAVAAASPAAWRAWTAQLLTAGRERLAALGLALLLGFGAGVVTLYLFAILANTVAAGDTERLDFAVLLWLRERQSPTMDAVAWFFSLLGSELVAVFLVLLVGLFVVRRRWGAAAALLLVTVGAQLQNNVLKDLFQRTRPSPVTGLIHAQAFSFPSGHAMVAAAFYAFMAYLSWRLLRGWLRVACVGTLALVVILIGASRLYLGVHYFTDVVAGYLAGLFWTNAVIIGGALLARRKRVAGPASASVAVPVAAASDTPAPTAAPATSTGPAPTAHTSGTATPDSASAATAHPGPQLAPPEPAGATPRRSDP